MEVILHSRVARLGTASAASATKLLNSTFGPGGFRCRANAPCSSVVFEASSDLVQWLPLTTNATANGATELCDDHAQTLTARFYRIRQQ
jgi:hypothetical protein